MWAASPRCLHWWRCCSSSSCSFSLLFLRAIWDSSPGCSCSCNLIYLGPRHLIAFVIQNYYAQCLQWFGRDKCYPQYKLSHFCDLSKLFLVKLLLNVDNQCHFVTFHPFPRDEIFTGWFFYWSALKNGLKCQITCKSLQKSVRIS